MPKLGNEKSQYVVTNQNIKQITVSLQKQVEKHGDELIRLWDQILDFRGIKSSFEIHENTEGTVIKMLRGGRAAV